MATILPSESLQHLLDILSGAFAGGVSARLYTSPGRITGKTTLADIQEANFPGYARVSLSSFSVVTIYPAVRLVGPTAAFAWEGLGDPQTIIGAYLVGSAESLLWVEPFLGPLVMLDSASYCEWQPVLQFRSVSY